MPGQQGARDEIVLRVVIVNGSATILFTIGYVLLGIDEDRDTASLVQCGWFRWVLRHIC